MASYTVQIPQDSLSQDRKAAVEKAVALAEAEITGAPQHLTKVAIVEVDSGCFYFNGRLLECDQIFVHGVTVENPQRSVKERLIARLTSDVATAADHDPDLVFVTISEISPDRMQVSTRTP